MIRGQSEYIGAVVIVLITVSAIVLLMQWYVSIVKVSEEALKRIEKAEEDVHLYMDSHSKSLIAINRGLRTSILDYIYLQLKNRTIIVEKTSISLEPNKEIVLPVNNIDSLENVETVCIETKDRNVFCTKRVTGNWIHKPDEEVQKLSQISLCVAMFSKIVINEDLWNIFRDYYVTNCTKVELPREIPSIYVYLNLDTVDLVPVGYRVVFGSYDSGWRYVYSLPSELEILNNEFILSDFSLGKLVARVRMVYRFERFSTIVDRYRENWRYVTAYPKTVEVELKLVSNSNRYLLIATSRSFSTEDYGANDKDYRCNIGPQNDNNCYLLKALASRTGYWDTSGTCLPGQCIISRRYDLCGQQVIVSSTIANYVPHTSNACISGANAFFIERFTLIQQPNRRIYNNYSYTTIPSQNQLTLTRYVFELDITDETTYGLYGNPYSVGIDKVLAVYDRNGDLYYTQNCVINAKNPAQQTISIGLWYNGDLSIYVFELNKN